MSAFRYPLAFLLLLLIPLEVLLRKGGLLCLPQLITTLEDWDEGGSSKGGNSGREAMLAKGGGDGKLGIRSGSAARECGVLFRFCLALSNAAAVCCYVCIVIAAAGPISSVQEKVYQSIGATVMFVLDTSPSMASRDMEGETRLEAAKNAIRQIVSKMGGAAVGLTAMASEAAVIVPPTPDRGTFQRRLDALSPGYMGDGTALGTAIATCCCHIGMAKEKYCVLVTDGENNAGFVSGTTAAAMLPKQGITLYVLGVGKSGSAPLDYTDPQTGKSYSGTFQSSFDDAQLISMAQAAGGKYFYIQGLNDLAAVLQEVSRRVTLTQSYYLRQQTTDQSTTPIVCALIFAMAAWVIKRLILEEVL